VADFDGRDFDITDDLQRLIVAIGVRSSMRERPNSFTVEEDLDRVGFIVNGQIEASSLLERETSLTLLIAPITVVLSVAYDVLFAESWVKVKQSVFAIQSNEVHAEITLRHTIDVDSLSRSQESSVELSVEGDLEIATTPMHSSEDNITSDLQIVDGGVRVSMLEVGKMFLICRDFVLVVMHSDSQIELLVLVERI